MQRRVLHKLLNYCIVLIWLANGLFCKLLHMVPRHEHIVARILGEAYSGVLTSLIGFSEIVMAIWVFSCYKSRLNAIVQMVIIGTMNLLEFFLAPDLLLWGKFNSLFALILISVVYLNEFILKPKQVQ